MRKWGWSQRYAHRACTSWLDIPETTVNETTEPQNPQDEPNSTSLTDEELNVASGGKGTDGDQVIIVETGMQPGVIA